MADPRDAELLNLRAYVGTLERQLADAKDLASEYQRRQSAAKALLLDLQQAARSQDLTWSGAVQLALQALDALQ